LSEKRDFSSRVSGFYNKTIEERIKIIAEKTGLSSEEIDIINQGEGLSISAADQMTENVITTIAYPFSIAVNFRINGKDYFIPMAGEEPSVVAAASNMARLMRSGKGIQTSSSEPIMIGQIQLLDIQDFGKAEKSIHNHKKELLEFANQQDPILLRVGGGAKDIETRVIDTKVGKMLIIHLLVDCRDAMGANAVNTMCEAISKKASKLTKGRPLLRIIGGEKAVDNIISAWAFADADPYRAATHNKGIMNGSIAVALALAQDHRAIEAGVHSYAAREGRYSSLSKWSKDENGDLIGVVEMPMAVGLIGGATSTHPIAQIARKILSVENASELSEIIVAVGLAQNLGALRALTQEGIQAGHMKLHARNLAIMAGASDKIVETVVERLIESGQIGFQKGKEIVESLTQN
jgi:hydroxymethylglutaryl-CoA reductase